MAQSARYYFTAPDTMPEIDKWVKAQGRVSESLQVVIRNFIAKYGYVDATSLRFHLDEPGQDGPVFWDSEVPNAADPKTKKPTDAAKQEETDEEKTNRLLDELLM